MLILQEYFKDVYRELLRNMMNFIYFDCLIGKEMILNLFKLKTYKQIIINNNKLTRKSKFLRNL